MVLFLLVVLLLVIMPALLYIVGWGVKRYTEKPPAWIGFTTAPERPSKKPDADAPTRVKA